MKLDAGIAVVVASVLAMATAGCGDGTEPPRWAGPAPNAKPMSSGDAASVDRVARAALKRANGQTPGMWIGIWHPRHGRHLSGYGEAIPPYEDATAADHGRIGGLAGTFVATAVLRQVEEGRLSLDDTVADVLPGLAESRPAIAAVTVERLLEMTSGVSDLGGSRPIVARVIDEVTDVLTVDEIVDVVLGDGRPDRPGYAETGSLILGEMLRRVTGDPLRHTVADLAREAGLDETALAPPGEIEMPEPFSHGYVERPGVEELAALGLTIRLNADVLRWPAAWGGPAGSMNTTVGDLGEWAATGYGTALHGEPIARRRLRHRVAGGERGLGIADLGHGWIGHEGSPLGWEAMALYNVRTGAVAVAIVNEADSLVRAERVIETAFPDLRDRLPIAGRL